MVASACVRVSSHIYVARKPTVMLTAIISDVMCFFGFLGYLKASFTLSKF